MEAGKPMSPADQDALRKRLQKEEKQRLHEAKTAEAAAAAAANLGSDSENDGTKQGETVTNKETAKHNKPKKDGKFKKGN